MQTNAHVQMSSQLEESLEAVSRHIRSCKIEHGGACEDSTQEHAHSVLANVLHVLEIGQAGEANKRTILPCANARRV